MILDAPFWTKNEPGVAHEGAPLRPVRFQVEFHHMAKAAVAYPGCGQEQLLLNEPGLLCAFRRFQPSIPIETSHLFRTKPAGDSDDPSRVAARVASW